MKTVFIILGVTDCATGIIENKAFEIRELAEKYRDQLLKDDTFSPETGLLFDIIELQLITK